MKWLLPSLLSVTLLCSCSTKAPKDPGKESAPKTPKIVGDRDDEGVSFDAKQLANEMESNYVTEIRFRKGSDSLTPAARRSLSALIRQARKGKSLGTAKLITWADQEMPTKKKEELPGTQVELAKRRNDALARFIQHEERRIDVDPISMAERPAGLKQYIPNETARIQESLSRAGIPEKGEKKHGLGKASRSIVIFTRE